MFDLNFIGWCFQEVLLLVNVIYCFGGLSHLTDNNKILFLFLWEILFKLYKSYTHGLAVHIPTDLLTVTKYVRGYMANLL